MAKANEFDFKGTVNFGEDILTDPPEYDVKFNNAVQGVSYLSATGSELLQSTDDGNKTTLQTEFSKSAAVDVEGRLEIVTPDNGQPYARLASIKKVTPRPE